MATEYDVAIVGFGPSGAVAAGLLGQAGIRTFVCDRAKEVYDKPRFLIHGGSRSKASLRSGVVNEILEFVDADGRSDDAPGSGRLHLAGAGQVFHGVQAGGRGGSCESARKWYPSRSQVKILEQLKKSTRRWRPGRCRGLTSVLIHRLSDKGRTVARDQVVRWYALAP